MRKTLLWVLLVVLIWLVGSACDTPTGPDAVNCLDTATVHTSTAETYNHATGTADTTTLRATTSGTCGRLPRRSWSEASPSTYVPVAASVSAQRGRKNLRSVKDAQHYQAYITAYAA